SPASSGRWPDGSAPPRASISCKHASPGARLTGRTRRLRWLVVVVLLAVGLTGVYFYSQSTGNAPRFRTAPVTRGTLTAFVTTTGNLNAVITVQVGSQVSGRGTAPCAGFN